ncbi:MAG: type I methionyl aminopeptidase [Acidobacteriota bacterium]
MRANANAKITNQLSKTDETLVWEAAQIVVEIHHRLADWLHHGVTLAQVDRFVGTLLKERKVRSAFKRYRIPPHPPFPSHACLSVNDCVVHGTAGYYREGMAPGDVLKIDIGVVHRGWIGDAAWTYVFGEPNDETRRLMDAGKESIAKGVEVFEPGAPLVRWARTVQTCVEEEHGLYLVRGLGGHGYGKTLHNPPFVSNVVLASEEQWPDAMTRCEPGMLLAVEPMIAVGTGQTRQTHRKAWPIFTADGSNAVHYEHDVLVTENGPRLLTAGIEEVVDVITR